MYKVLNCLRFSSFELCIHRYSANIEQVIMTITCHIYALYLIFYFICLHLSEIGAYRDARNTCLGGAND